MLMMMYWSQLNPTAATILSLSYSQMARSKDWHWLIEINGMGRLSGSFSCKSLGPGAQEVTSSVLHNVARLFGGKQLTMT